MNEQQCDTKADVARDIKQSVDAIVELHNLDPDLQITGGGGGW